MNRGFCGLLLISRAHSSTTRAERTLWFRRAFNSTSRAVSLRFSASQTKFVCSPSLSISILSNKVSHVTVSFLTSTKRTHLSQWTCLHPDGDCGPITTAVRENEAKKFVFFFFFSSLAFLEMLATAFSRVDRHLFVKCSTFVAHFKSTTRLYGWPVNDGNRRQKCFICFPIESNYSIRATLYSQRVDIAHKK